MQDRASVSWEGVKESAQEQDRDRDWSENALLTTNLRVTDLDLTQGAPISKWEHGATLWNSISALHSRVEVKAATLAVDALTTTVASHEDELTQIFEKTSGFQSGLVSRLTTLINRMDALEGDGTRGEDMVDTMDDLRKKIDELSNDRIHDRLRIESLEARLESGSDQYKLMSRDSL